MEDFEKRDAALDSVLDAGMRRVRRSANGTRQNPEADGDKQEIIKEIEDLLDNMEAGRLRPKPMIVSAEYRRSDIVFAHIDEALAEAAITGFGVEVSPTAA